MKVLDIFSGIGGFSLGLTRAGMRTVAFCEIEEYPRSILRKHWPTVPIFEDVRNLHAEDLPEAVDLICGEDTRASRSVLPGSGKARTMTASRVARLRALGNAVVPQIPELIGKIIMEIEKSELHKVPAHNRIRSAAILRTLQQDHPRRR